MTDIRQTTKKSLSAKCLKDNKRSCWQTLTRWKCLLIFLKRKSSLSWVGSHDLFITPSFISCMFVPPYILPPNMNICQKISAGWRRQDWYGRVQTTFQQEVKVILQKLSFSVLILFLQKWSGENTRSRKWTAYYKTQKHMERNVFVNWVIYEKAFPFVRFILTTFM